MKPGQSPNVVNPGLSLSAGLAIAGKNTSPQNDLSSQNTMDANRLAKVPDRPSEGTAPLGNKLAPLPLPN